MVREELFVNERDHPTFPGILQYRYHLRLVSRYNVNNISDAASSSSIEETKSSSVSLKYLGMRYH